MLGSYNYCKTEDNYYFLDYKKIDDKNKIGIIK